MSYQSLIETALDALVGKIHGLKIGEQPVFKTVAMTEPAKLNITRMPAVYVLLDQDRIEKKAQFLEIHTLGVSISVVQVVKGTAHGDTELEKGFHDGVTMVGAVYDALAADRTLGKKTGYIEIKQIEYGRTPLDVGVVFWGELQIEFDMRYAPGKPTDPNMIQEVYTRAKEVR